MLPPPQDERNLALQQPWAGRAWQGARRKTDPLCPLLRPAAPELSHGVGGLALQKKKAQRHSHPLLASLPPNEGQKQHPFPGAVGLLCEPCPRPPAAGVGGAAGTGNKVTALRKKPNFLRRSLGTGGSPNVQGGGRVVSELENIVHPSSVTLCLYLERGIQQTACFSACGLGLTPGPEELGKAGRLVGEPCGCTP